MTDLRTPHYWALGLLAVVFISTTALAQTTPAPGDPFALVPAGDGLLVLDVKRFTADAIPQLLANEPEARALVIAVSDPGATELLDPRAIQRVILGVRFAKPGDGKNPSDFDVVTIAQSSEAGQLAALIRSRGAGKYREQQYAGKTLYLTPFAQAGPERNPTSSTNSDETEWAIVALDANTLVFGSPAYVRASIDLSSGKGTPVEAEFVAALKRNSTALLSVTGVLPPSLMSAGQQSMNDSFSQMLSSLKRFYGSVELTPAGFQVSVTVGTTSSEQTKSIVEVLNAFKTMSVTLIPGKTKQELVTRDLLKSLVVSGEGTEVQIRDQISQASANQLTKFGAAYTYFARGVAQVQKGNPDAAIAEYDKAIILDPENASYFINRGSARSKKGARDAAIADYDKAISLDPNSTVAYNNRCFEQVEKRNFEAAIVDCDKAIALDPTNAYAYNNRGLAFDSLGKLDKALPDYDKSIALDGENIFAYQNRGDARGQIGNWDGSLADYEKVIALDANSALGYNGRGLARYSRGELDLAIADFNKALALNPSSAGTYNNRGLALSIKGDLDKATADYDKSIALNDKDEVSYVNRGNLRNQKGDLNGALADFDRAIAINPNIADAYNGRGLTYYLTNRCVLAIADYDRAIAINPNVAEIYGNRALCLVTLRKDAEAERDLVKCFELKPSLRATFEPAVKEIKKTRPKARKR